ncbi:MAG TPA: chemotaxis protein CheW [Anaeromyxobacteraceae bacterium]|nr:chemotaxis protein CheW [Anaeromyxobacteraceae bacterium]
MSLRRDGARQGAGPPGIEPPRLIPGDIEMLERRARALASGGPGEADEVAGDRLVAFRLGGNPCAVDALAVERALPRIPPVLPVPAMDGFERAITWVDERPMPVADLAGAAAGEARAAPDLSGLPAIVVATPQGPVAVAVDGPLELREDRLAGSAPPAREDEPGLRPRLRGRLPDGTSVLDEEWMAAWAARAVRP